MKLVVVESPAKAKTIEKYLGPGHKVLASYGHVRDLPAKDGSVRPDDNFAMDWEAYPDKAKQLKAIADAAKDADALILATDPDREGEAISWHVQEVLRKKKALPAKVDRVTFNAITKSAVTEAMGRPRELDEDLINAYKARRALDYLVGFTLSPILWRKLPGAKSAGRVQSVALRLIVDREREIELFRSQEYWQVSASFEADGTPFTARLVALDGQKVDRLTIGDKGSADAAKKVVEDGRFTVASVETKPLTKNPPPPFTTSTLQQEAARKLGFSASQTMRVAQSLYEDGLITYMRTDGVQMAGEAISAARKAVADRYDAGYLPDKPRQYSSKAKNAQEAHEAIRPTDFTKDRAASGDHARLYSLIFNRALASQMASARIERTTAELTDGAGRATLRATGQVTIFPGFMALYDEGRDDVADEEGARMPQLRSGDAPVKTGVEATQHFTQPPPRYSEASLVKRLEELGIGRPSTYAATLQTLKDREYVRLDKARFIPEESGRLVTAFLERFFERYVSFDYTAELEEELDDVSGGRLDWLKLLDDFWRDFKPKAGEVMDQKPSDVTAALDDFLSPWLFPDKGDGSDPRLCPLCGTGQLSLRGGRYGAFVACSNYPECKYTRRFGQGEEAASEGPAEIGNGIVLKSGRFGPYLERDGARASLPKDVPQDGLTLEMAEKLLSLPREIGPHPETGTPITASIGRYGPYLAHDGKYARLGSTAEVFDTGMNAAVVKLAEAAAAKGERGGSREPIAVLGPHPDSGKEIRVMAGRYGPYVSDGVIHATLPKSAEPSAVTLDEAVALINAKAAKGPASKNTRGARGRKKK
ncbi:type I DNA topoisomerase [Sphingomonas sp. RB56-2]|uniref:DNA topoisomerase 1 n=1 Tax=Sphingomonas brevis TaxID=2908206 RepID=A0ABT0S6H3_9SPHN|nr:type I DNA topoisomerase [Sphingomonas brevis]MCL6739983.1 type I DNA topoisomerase [Sphingomonas brevis]